MSSAAKVSVRVAAVAAGVLVALLLAEGLLRLFDPGSAAMRGLHQVRPDRTWLYGLEPGAETRIPATGEVVYAINADGFRDRSYARPKPSSVFRVVVLGDSVTFGYGVEAEQTFAKALERDLEALAKASGRRIEVLNLGVSGYNPFTEAALLADVAATYQPDLVLAQFCVNDLNDPTLHFDTNTALALGAIPDAAFPDPRARSPAQGTLRRWCARSRLCVRALAALGVSATSRAADVAALAPHEEPSDTEIAWLAEMYGRMARTAAAHGARFALVVFPFETQLAGKTVGGEDPVLQQRLRELGARAGFPVIDLLPPLREQARGGGGPLFLDLWHPSARGHAVAAAELARALIAAGLVPGGQAAHSAP